MIGLEIEFTARRYHATAWGHHVNEGELDWPPSPWRILRALLAAWHSKARDVVTEEALRGVIGALSEAPPVYDLPRASAGHARHYMPSYRVDKSSNTSKVIDAFLHVEEPVRVIWPEATLAGEELEALRRLAERVGYLGRAESWVAMTVLTDWSGAPNAAPVGRGALDGSGERVRVLAPVSEAEYAEFRRGWLEASEAELLAGKRRAALEAGKALEKIRITPKERRGLTERLGDDLLAALDASTSSLQRHGWSLPPGSCQVEYERPLDAVAIAPRRRRRPERAARPQVARYVVVSQAPPRMTDAVRVADDVHRALVDRSDGAAVFTGCRDDRRPRQDDHQHAHVFCEGYGHQGRVTHIAVFAPEGFDAEAQRCLESLRAIRRRDAPDLQLALLGMGLPDDMGGADASTGASPLFHTARVWRSVTPFIATRHPKVTRAGRPKIDPESQLQKGSPAHDLLRLISLQGLPTPEAVEPIDGARFSEADRLTRWSHFQTRRQRGRNHSRRGPSAAAGFEVRFAEPISGPLAFGCMRHFGLGVFAPVE